LEKPWTWVLDHRSMKGWASGTTPSSVDNLCKTICMDEGQEAPKIQHIQHVQLFVVNNWKCNFMIQARPETERQEKSFRLLQSIRLRKQQYCLQSILIVSRLVVDCLLRLRSSFRLSNSRQRNTEQRTTDCASKSPSWLCVDEETLYQPPAQDG